MAANDAEADPTELLVRARAGDGLAFGALIGPYRGELRLHAYRMLGSPDDAEDIVQDSLTRAWQSLSSYEDRGTVRAWLYRIVTNRCLTVLGRASRRALPTDFSGEGFEEIHWIKPLPATHTAHLSAYDPEARTAALETVELAFLTAAHRLPPRQRAVLLLRDVLGFTAAETAELLGMTAAAVNSALQRAKAHQQNAPQAQLVENTEVGLAAQRYAKAWEAGDVEAIISMLADDVRYSMPPLPHVFSGASQVRGFLHTGPLQHPGQSWLFLPTSANGQLAFGTYLREATAPAYEPAGLDVLSFSSSGQVTEVVSFLEADLTDFGLPQRLTAP